MKYIYLMIVLAFSSCLSMNKDYFSKNQIEKSTIYLYEDKRNFISINRSSCVILFGSYEFQDSKDEKVLLSYEVLSFEPTNREHPMFYASDSSYVLFSPLKFLYKKKVFGTEMFYSSLEPKFIEYLDVNFMFNGEYCNLYIPNEVLNLLNWKMINLDNLCLNSFGEIWNINTEYKLLSIKEWEVISKQNGFPEDFLE